MLFHDFIKVKADTSATSLIVDKNQNLLKPEILKMVENVTTLMIVCGEYPIALESLLKLITQNNIERVTIIGGKWLAFVKSGSSLDVISSKYRKANYDLMFRIPDPFVNKMFGGDNENALFIRPSE